MNIFEGVEFNFFQALFGFSISNWVVYTFLAIVIFIGLLLSSKKKITRRKVVSDYYYEPKSYYRKYKKSYSNYSNPIRFNKPKVKFKPTRRYYK